MAADLSPTNPSSSNSSSTVNSPKFSRKTPWAGVVRAAGGEPMTSAAKATSFPEKPTTPFDSPEAEAEAAQEDAAAAAEAVSSESSNGNAKNSVWGRPENGVVEAESVMGVSWPTISESTRPLSKSSSSGPLKPASNGSTVSISQGLSLSNATLKHGNTNGNLNLTPKHSQHARQRSTKRDGGAGSGSGHSGFSRPPPPVTPLATVPPPAAGPPPTAGPPPPPPFPPPFPILFGNLLPPVVELPVRAPPYNGNNWKTRPAGGVGSYSQSGSNHSSHRQFSRRGNSGSRPRGDGGLHNGYGGRRDQDRDWNGPRTSTARDVRMHQMGPSPQDFMRPAIPGSIPFIPPQHVRPFGNPMGFDMVPPFLYSPPLPPENLRGVPFIAHTPPPPMFLPVVDPNLRTLLLNQIEYYFSDANLIKDDFLRSNMDDQGWVHINLIANFPRVLNLTSNIQLILDTLGASTIVEVQIIPQGDKVRRCEDWRKWISPFGQVPPAPSSPSPSESTDNMLATSIQKVSLEEISSNQLSTDMGDCHSAVDQSEAVVTRSKLDNVEDTAEAACSS